MNAKKIIFVIIAFFISASTVSAQTDTITTVANPVAGGSITGGGEYAPGSNVTLLAIPNEGYLFDNWTENASELSTDSSYSFVSAGNQTITANFSLKSYTISTTVNPPSGGNISGSGTYLHGDSVELTAISAEGYSFVNWTENGSEVSTDSIYSFIADQNRDLIANFDLNSYEIKADILPALSGTVTGDGQYFYGDTAQLVALPTQGYFFKNWTEGGVEVSTDSVFSFTVDKNRTLTANFELF